MAGSGTSVAPSPTGALRLSAFGRRESLAAVGLGAAVLVLLWLQVVWGYAGKLESATVFQGLAAWLGLGEALPLKEQVVVELRAWRGFCAAGVGAALAASGAMLQGLFRNPLASPSLLGVTTGASLGATLAILALGGYAGSWLAGDAATAWSPVVLTLGAFGGALAVGLLILGVISSVKGRHIALLTDRCIPLNQQRRTSPTSVLGIRCLSSGC